MAKDKKSPAPNEAPNPKIKEVKQSVIDLAEEFYETWKPVLRFEGTQLLGKRLAIVTSELAHLVADNQILRASNKNLQDRLLEMELGYSQLCDAHDENKRLHHEIGVRQKNHIDTCDKNFQRIKVAIEKLQGR